MLDQVQHDASVTGGDETRTSARRALSLGAAVAVLGALCLSCARHPTSVAPPIAPAGTQSAAAAPPSSPAPSASVPLASLTSAAGRPVWSRDEVPGAGAVTTGDAVVALEAATSPPPTASLPPTGSLPPAPTGSTGSPPAAGAPSAPSPPGATYHLVVLDGANGKVRATHRLGGAGRTPPGRLTAKTYRRAPVATVSVPGPSASSSTIEAAYDSAGRRVWRSPHDGLELFGDEGEYTTAGGYTKPPIGGPLTPVQELKTLSGADLVTFGPSSGEQVTFVHGGAAVVTRGQGFRVATATRHPRTLWPSSRAAPHGFTGATPIAVLGDRLLVQWADASSHHLLALYDLKDGRQEWRSETLAGQVTAGAVVEDADSHVAVIGSDGTGPALGLDMRTGKIEWRVTGRQNVRPVAAAHGRVYGASGDSALVLDVRTGRVTTLGTHVEVVGLTSKGVLVLRGAMSAAAARIWALRPPATSP
jgi:hypothetical protein